MSDPLPRITSMEVRPRPAFDDFMAPFVEHERRRRADDAEMLKALRRLDEDWPDDPAVPDLACELAVRLGISANSAAERLRIARALRDLPEIARAHREGRLSWDQLRWVTKFATAETDEEWATRAASMRPAALRLEFLRQQRAERAAAERDHATRALDTEWDEERRFLSICGSLAREQGAAFEEALHHAVERVGLDEDADDPPSARRADALVALVSSSGASPRPATLVVHVDQDALRPANPEQRRLAETSRGIQIPDDAVRRLACDANVRVALERSGRVVGIASAGRAVTSRQMELLRFRDRHCRFPGCESTWFLHAHHIRHWADGGKTTLDNLTLLCGSHHRRVHEGRWTIRGRPPDGLEFVSRSRRVVGGAPALARAG